MSNPHRFLQRAAGWVAFPQIRDVVTLAGNLCTDTPSADTPSPGTGHPCTPHQHPGYPGNTAD
ncbi:MAG: hypothetical protein HFG02_09590 [Oscillibacter sp.]|nr:hypothetical protein [Oscillibacter sp.]